MKTGVVNVLAQSLKNTYKFHFVSKVAGRMFLRINFFIDTTLPTFQRRINIVSTLWITFQIALTRCWKWDQIQSRIFNVAQHWYHVGVQRWNNVKSTLCNVNATVFQRCTLSLQRCFSVDMTLSQRCSNVASALVKAISRPIWLMKSMDLQKDW